MTSEVRSFPDRIGIETGRLEEITSAFQSVVASLSERSASNSAAPQARGLNHTHSFKDSR
ncbi:MAG: hypothetical protein CL933_17920 [Deltaproteobacteria bacterium]|nr:hypothetical protein [Deltaproteobacteria bacterium]